jgi:hypothetical protein
MDVVQRVKGILLTPETEWQAIEKEPGTPGFLFPNYVAYLAAIPPVAGFIGRCMVGVATPAGTVRVPLFIGLLGAVIEYVLSFAIVYAIAIVIDQLAPRFGGLKDFPSALKVTVYSFTPVWVAGVLQLLPGLRFVAIVIAFFGVYIAWLGLPRLMRAPRDKAMPYVAVSVACALTITAALMLVEEAVFT